MRPLFSNSALAGTGPTIVAAPSNDNLKNTVTGTKSGQCAGSAF
jgi:hypothetical protein